jgi:uncharacterized protein involved in exopolysaccharide biosynthesis
MKITLRDLLSIVFRFGRLLVIFWAVAVVAIVVYYTQTARSYSSKARILVSLGSEDEGRGDYTNSQNVQLIQREQQIHNEQQILLSEHVSLTTAKWMLGEPTPDDPAPPMGPEVAEARRYLTGEAPEPTPLLKLVKLTGEAVGVVLKAMPFGHKTPIPESTKLATALAKGLDAKTIFESDALDVSFRYRDPRVAQTVLKLVLAAYMDRHIAVFQSAGESDLLKSELDRSTNQYQQRLDEMANYMTSHHIFAEDAQLNASIQLRQQISQSLSAAQAESEASSARLGTFNGLNSSLKQYETYSTVQARSKVRDELETKLHDAEVQEQQILSNHTAESQTHQDQVAVLARIRQLLASQPAQVVDQTEQRRSGASQLVEQQIIGATAAQKGDQAQVTQLKSDLNRANETIDEYAKNLPGYDMIKLNLDFSKGQSEQMGKAYVDSRLRALTAQNAITDISVIDAPSWEPEPVSPKMSVIAILSLALLVLGSIAIILAAVGLDQTVNDRPTTENVFGLPVTAVFPIVSADAGSTPTLLTPQTESEFARIYTLVRQFSKPGVVILLSGANGGEGVSLIGYQLASFLGRNAASRTALLDCTAHPGPHSSDPSQPVLLSMTGGQESTSGDLGGGVVSPSTANPSELMELWRTEFTYIVIASSVANEIYKLVDVLPSVSATFVVIEAGRTRRATATNAINLLSSYGVHDIHLILNKRSFFIPDWLMRRI